ncbi:MAG: ankyrin repeat domain-containing protein [Tepidisphaeraceae bacterium]|jgi:hypothetical protein
MKWLKSLFGLNPKPDSAANAGDAASVRKARIERFLSKCDEGWTPLHFDAYWGDRTGIEAWVHAGLDKDPKDKDGKTPLHIAAFRGHASWVEALLKLGADKEAKDNEGWTSLHLAAAMGRASVVDVLLQAGADQGARIPNGKTALDLAQEEGHASIVEILRNADALAHAHPHRPVTGGGSQLQARNLARWERSAYPRKWVDDHRGQWTHSDWLQLLQELKQTDFWPMEPDAIGRVLEEHKKAPPSMQSESFEAFGWCKGKPNPTSPQVTRFGTGGVSLGVRFLCPTCSTPNTALDSQIDDVTGVLVKCDCGNISHVPAAYKTQADISGLAVHGGVRVPIAEFEEWMFAHPSFLTADGRHVHPDTEFHGNYGLWGFCAGCHYQYASTVLAIFHSINPDGLFKGGSVFLNVHSAKSGQDAEALRKKQCPQCGNPDLIAIMVDIPKYVRDAVNAEKRKRGL